MRRSSEARIGRPRRRSRSSSEYARRQPTGKSRQLDPAIRRLASRACSATAPEASPRSGSSATELYATSTAGTCQARATDHFENLPVGLVFRSVGYRGVPLPGVPFNESWGVILNEKGRVLDSDTKQPIVGEYAAGWIKRGPTGVIGTNKPDAAETVDACSRISPSARCSSRLYPESGRRRGASSASASRAYFSYADWLKLDAIEVERGRAQGRPRVKLTSIDEMLAALGR